MSNELHSAPLTGHFPFCVEPFQEDITGQLSWGVLGNLLLRCANLHAGSLNYGYKDMIARQHVWVLARLIVEIDRMPRTEERYDIATWFAGYYRQFSDRKYLITNDNGEPIGRALTVWSLINTETRTAADLAQFGGNTFDACIVSRELSLAAPARIRIKANTPERQLTAHFSDLDINGHVNSIRYLSHALDLFPLSFHTAHTLRRIEMAYSAETFAGDTISYYHDEISPLTHHIEVRKHTPLSPTEEVVCRICLIFSEASA